MQTYLSHRIRKTRAMMRANKLQWLLLVRPSDVSYLTGFLGQDSWAIVTDRRVCLLTDSRYLEQARAECPSARIVERMVTLANTVSQLARTHKPRLIGVDEAITLENWLAIGSNTGCRLKQVAGPLCQIRSVKDDLEIRMIQKAGLIARRALRRALGQISPGITELALAGLIELEIRKAGAWPGFETIVAFGANASRPHHQPTERPLRSNDTILVDFGARFRGYRSDITRCFVIGQPDKLFLKAYQVVVQAQAKAIAGVRPGVPLSQIDAIPRQVIKESGLPVYGHGSGHGIGLDIHEDPFLKPKAQGSLKVGQVLTIEPGIYLPGRLGVRLEDDVLVTKDGCKVLTRTGPHSFRLDASC